MEDKKAYIVATAHLDTVWRWNLAKTIKEHIPDTISKNLDLFEKHPNYRFNFEGAYRYELIEEYYPKHFEIIKELVDENKWCPTGSSYENGDVNIPSPEALFRNILYGNSYFKKKFGKETNDIFLPDCFGFGYALPTIMAHSGLKGFSTQKLSWGSANGVPFDIGYWQGVDGSKVYAAIDAKSYRSKIDNDIRNNDTILEKVTNNAFRYGLPQTLNYYGTGDIGGAPDEESVINLENAVKENDENSFKIISASSQDLFNDLDNTSEDTKNNLPVFNGELVMTTHGTGSYTSRTISKRLNAKNENLAELTEKACVIADILGVYKYPAENITKAWKRVIRHHFHDDITGTSIMEVYNDSCNDYFVSLNEFQNEYIGAVNAITNKLDTSWVTECAVIINNPACYDRKDAVNAHVKIKHNCSFVKVLDKNGNEVPSQIIKKTGKEFDIIFLAEVKALGFRVYDVVPSTEKCNIKTDLLVTEHTLENSKYKVIFNKNGDIASITDKELNKQILEKPIKMALLNDIGSQVYPSWEINKSDIDKEPLCYANSPKFEIAENGPAKISIKITREADYSSITQVVSLSSESKFISVYNFVDWQSRRRMLKAVFPFTAYNSAANYDLGIGVIKRDTNKDNMYEVPAQKWADITDNSGNFGVSVFSDCKYGWDKPNDNTLRLTCIHTPAGAFDKNSRQDLQDIGRNIFSFGIFSHHGGYEVGTQIQNEFYQKPLIAFQTNSRSEGNLSDQFSFASIKDGNIIIRAIKNAEDENGFILRLTESNGTAQNNVKIDFFNNIQNAEEVFANEKFKQNANINGNTLTFNIKPFEVKSFRINLKKLDFKETTVSNTLKLKYNVKGFTSNDDMRNVILQGGGCSLPAELCPEEITVRGIKFNLPDTKGNFDVLVARGQEIELPKESDKIYIIAASTLADREETFLIDNKEKKITIHSFNEPIAQWDMFGLEQTALIKTANPVIEFTHTHHPEGDIANGKVYFYMYEIDVKNANKLTLPEDNRIIILAMTTISKSTYTTLSTEIIDKIENDNYQFAKTAPVEKVVEKTTGMVTDVKERIEIEYNKNKSKLEGKKNSIKKFINLHKNKK